MGSMPSFPRSVLTLLRAGIACQPSGVPRAPASRSVRAQSPWPASREWPPPACRRRSRGGALRLGVACTPHRPPARRGRSGRRVWRRCPSRSGRRGPATRRRAPGPRAARRRACPSPPTCASPPSRASLPWRRWLPRRAHRRRRTRGGRARCRGRRGRRGRSAAVSRVRSRFGPRFPPQSQRTREAILTDLCTLLRPPASPRGASRVATVYTNAPKRLQEAILANLCTLLRRHPGGEARIAGAVTQPPTRTNS